MSLLAIFLNFHLIFFLTFIYIFKHLKNLIIYLFIIYFSVNDNKNIYFCFLENFYGSYRCFRCFRSDQRRFFGKSKKEPKKLGEMFFPAFIFFFYFIILIYHRTISLYLLFYFPFCFVLFYFIVLYYFIAFSYFILFHCFIIFYRLIFIISHFFYVEFLLQVRLRNISLRTTLRKLERTYRAREQLAEGLHMIDFEQLKIENQTLHEKIEERNEELSKLKRKKTITVQVKKLMKI